MSDAIDDFIIVTEVDRGPAFAEPIFQRKYKASVPDFGHHVVAFWKRGDGSFVPASYVHFTDCGDIYLAGGAATDGNVLRAMDEAQRRALEAYGALMLATLRYGFERWGPHCDAVFTCCGDARALETTPKVGFVDTGVPHLLVRWMREPTLRRRRELVAKARSFMPF
ncbi:MAG TPA: hypothetical protein PLN91_14300 [Rhodanobacteraceae bacterium]|nr:hypothetical protein [Rhodanobacteraceae bacterium]